MFWALLFASSMMLMGFGGSSSAQSTQTPTDLSGTVWRGYLDANILTYGNNAYENHNLHVFEVRFIGNTLVTIVLGHYRNGEFEAEKEASATSTIEYSYNRPRGKFVFKDKNADFTIDGNVLIFYDLDADRNTITRTAIRIK